MGKGKAWRSRLWKRRVDGGDGERAWKATQGGRGCGGGWRKREVVATGWVGGSVGMSKWRRVDEVREDERGY